MCAIEAGKRGRRVAVLEDADRLGKKILISRDVYSKRLQTLIDADLKAQEPGRLWDR